MHVGIIVFPGATCERDIEKWLLRHRHISTFISHKETFIPHHYDLLIIPGGFAFGDRIYEKATGDYIKDPGAKAVESPIMYALQGEIGYTPILGICNGFQILVHAGFLPGRLEQNEKKVFWCDETSCALVSPSIIGSPVGSYISPSHLPLPVAHGYGRYRVSPEEYLELRNRNQIFLLYTDNVNGSDYGIAGVSNHNHTVWGMMPHPERSSIANLILLEIEHYVNDVF